MRAGEKIFVGGDRERVKQLLASLQKAFGLTRERTAQVRRCYHDTFDWRVLRKGGALVEDESRRPSRLTWIASGGETLHGPFEGMTLSFARELPEGPFRDALLGVADVRRIEPKLRLRARAAQMALTDHVKKIVVRLELLDGSVRGLGRGGRSAPVTGQLRVRPVRGYERHFDHALRLLAEAGGELAPVQDELPLLLELLDVDPQATRSSFRMRLEATMPAAAGIKRILLRLARTMELNTEGTRRAVDSEYLHDFRVALRRTRSCLGQLKGVLDPQAVAPFIEEFRRLGQSTGIVRDLDVHHMELPAYREALDAGEAGSLEPIDRWLTDRQKKEQRRLSRALGSMHHKELMRGWIAFLEQPDDVAAEATPDADRELGQVARERIRLAYERIVRRGSKLKATTRVDKIHRLRIDCKKLRYLLEFFRSLFDAQRMDGAVRELKKLQDVLGEFNDLDVQSHSLRSIADELLADGKSEAGTLIAVGRLIERAQKRQAKLRKQLIPRVHTFVGDEVRQQFEEMTR